MNLHKSIYNKIPIVVSYLYIILFVYAATSKILDFNKFHTQLGQSPIFSAYADWIARLVPMMEIGLAGLLVVQKKVLITYYISLGLMVMFTTYIILILNFSDYVPCSCGGILENLDWNEHLVFNLCFIIMAISAIVVWEQRGYHLKNDL